MLLARIYEVFPLRCPRCGEPMRLIAFVTDSGSITRILAYLGEPTKAPHIAPAARGPPCGRRTSMHEGNTFALSEPLPEYEFRSAGELVRPFHSKSSASQGHLTGTGGLASQRPGARPCVTLKPRQPPTTRPEPAQTPLPAATRTTQSPTGPSDATVPVAKPR